MKVQKITKDNSKFEPFKVNIEISVESKEDQKLLLVLKHIATELFLGDEDGNAISSFQSVGIKQESEANNLIQNILSNL